MHNVKIIILLISLLLCVTVFVATSDLAGAACIDQQKIVAEPLSSIKIEHYTIVSHTPGTVIKQSMSPVTMSPVMRSDYRKRLTDLLEQINLGLEKGWLSSQEASELKHWDLDVAKEEEALRSAGGGILRRADADQLEHHVNCLAYTITQRINANISTAYTLKSTGTTE